MNVFAVFVVFFHFYLYHCHMNDLQGRSLSTFRPLFANLWKLFVHIELYFWIQNNSYLNLLKILLQSMASHHSTEWIMIKDLVALIFLCFPYKIRHFDATRQKIKQLRSVELLAILRKSTILYQLLQIRHYKCLFQYLDFS